VQTAGRLVVAGLELAPGVEDREDDFQGAFLRRGMFIDGNPPAVVLDVIDEPSACSVTLMSEAWPFIASSTELSRISQIRW
jgi:hypothetical protein